MKPTTVVDAHNHVIPERLVARLGDAGNPFRMHTQGDWIIYDEGGRHPLYREMYDVPTKLAVLDSKRIDTAAVSPAPPLLGCHLPAADAAAVCRLMNEGIAEFAAAAPDRLLPVAGLPLQDARVALDELERVDPAGIEVGAWSGGRPLGDPELRPFWRRVEERRLPVFVHPFSPAPQTGLGRYYMTNLVGNPVETAIAMADIILSGLLDDCPGLRFLMSHGGGFGPYQIGRWTHGYKARQDVRSSARRPPGDYLGSFFFDTITHDDTSLSFLIERVGSGHVLLGSDFPYDMADDDPLATVERQPLTAEARAAVAGRNALGLFARGRA